MRNPTNNFKVFKPKLVRSKTSYPIKVVDDDGNVSVAYQFVDDSDICNLSFDDFSLRSLLNAGIDPSNLGHISTSSVNRSDEIGVFASQMSSVEFPPVDSSSDSVVEPN